MITGQKTKDSLHLLTVHHQHLFSVQNRIISKEGNMNEWFSRVSFRRKQSKDDNFWSDFLQKRNELNQCENKNVRFHTNSMLNISSAPSSLISDRIEYQKNIFSNIFGKQFETTKVESVRKLPKNCSTYHFCQK